MNKFCYPEDFYQSAPMDTAKQLWQRQEAETFPLSVRERWEEKFSQ